MKPEINAKGLNQAEIQRAIDSAVEFKSLTPQEWGEKRKEYIREICQLVITEDQFAAEMLELIRLHHPKLLNEK